MITLECRGSTTFLPNPTLGDAENGVSEVTPHYAMDGTRRTYVKRSMDRQLSYTFRLTRMRALAMKEFILLHFDAKIKMTNHKDEVWEVYFLDNPFTFEALRRWKGLSESEEIGITLQFQGRKVA